jgi:rhodanese-related sulfurtransferase
LIHLSGSPNLQQFTAEQIAQQQRRGVLVLDTRPAGQFASFHIPGSMQLGLMGPFASWAAILIEPAQELILVAEGVTTAEEARSRLARVGLQHVLGFIVADKKHWQNHGLTLVSLPIHWCGDVCRHLRESGPLQLIDVRSSAEWLNGHLPGAISLPLLELHSEAASIDFARPSLVYCREGYRAPTAASLLLRNHASDIGILIDGIEGLQACGLPCETPVLPQRDHPGAPLSPVSQIPHEQKRPQ